MDNLGLYELKFKSWNINGYNSKYLGNKLLDCDFLNEVKAFDIVSLLETHAYGKDLQLPGYKSPFRRDEAPRGKTKKSFGGIAVFVKDYLIAEKVIKWVKTDNENVIWLKIDKKFLNA